MMTQVDVCGFWHDGETLVAFFDTDEGEAGFRAALMLPREDQQRLFFEMVEHYWKVGEVEGNRGATWMAVTKAPPHVTDNYIAYHTHAVGDRWSDADARFPNYYPEGE